MKTILFVSIGRLEPTMGGVHRVTHCLMTQLETRGYKCLYLDSSLDGTEFYTDNIEDSEHKLWASNVKQYLCNHKIDIIIDQQGVFSASFSSLFASFYLSNIKYITVFHNSPDIYKKTFTPKRLIYNLREAGCIKGYISNSIRLAAFPIWKLYSYRGSARLYKTNYGICDRCVMLSTKEIPTLEKYIGRDQSKKCVAINNPLTFDTIESESCLKSKTNTVLIVSRLDNFEKRIDLALKIWANVERAGIKDWTFKIVGFGIHEQKIRDQIKRLELQRVSLEGRQPSEPYYETASIFLMTSSIEGWGLTLTESMQKGVVPMAFDSYPAISDIITNGYDGILIKDKDIESYSRQLIELMQNNEMRKSLALNCLKSCSRFKIDKIVNQWVSLFETL